MKTGLTIQLVKEYTKQDKLDEKPGEPVSLEDRFEFLLDILSEKEVQIDELEAELKEFKKTWMNHRHGFGGVYTSKAER
jgi:hypothetical protein